MSCNIVAIISQREEQDKYGILIDVLESSYINYFESLGITLIPISNFYKDPKKVIEKIKPDLIILTGGGRVNPTYYLGDSDEFIQTNRDLTENILITDAINNQIPIIGICRGFQQLNGYFDGKISKLNYKQPREIKQDHYVKFKERQILVNNYHNDGVLKKNFGKKLDILCLDDENEIIEGIYSKEKKLIAIQWHPEREYKSKKSKKFVTEMLKKFIKNKGDIII